MNTTSVADWRSSTSRSGIPRGGHPRKSGVTESERRVFARTSKLQDVGSRVSRVFVSALRVSGSNYGALVPMRFSCKSACRPCEECIGIRWRACTGGTQAGTISSSAHAAVESPAMLPGPADRITADQPAQASEDLPGASSRCVKHPGSEFLEAPGKRGRSLQHPTLLQPETTSGTDGMQRLSPPPS